MSRKKDHFELDESAKTQKPTDRHSDTSRFQNKTLDHLVEIKDPVAADLIMKTFVDQTNRRILKICLHTPHTIMDMLNISGVPQSTGYRRILGLIKNQFLVQTDVVQKNNAKKTPRYVTAISSFQMVINDFKEISLKVRFSNKAFYREL